MTEEKVSTVLKTDKNEVAKKGPGACVIIAIIFACLLGLFFLLVGIGIFYGAGKMGLAIKQSGLKIDADKQSVSFKNPETGEQISVGQNVSIPKNFPDIPLYPGAKVVSVVTSDNNSTLVLGTRDSIDKVTSFYLREFPKKGWKAVETEQKGFIDFQNTSQHGEMIVLKVGEDTSITISVKDK